MKSDDDLRRALHDLAGQWHDDGRIRDRILERQQQQRRPGRHRTTALLATAAVVLLGAVSVPRLLDAGGDDRSLVAAGEDADTSRPEQASSSTTTQEAPATETSPPGSVGCRTDGPATVAVPDVIGLAAEDANQVLLGIGLAAQMVGPDPGDGVIVTEQEPYAGTTVPEGACVELWTAVPEADAAAGSDTAGSNAIGSETDGSGLAAAEAGREITFDRIGDFTLGQVLDPSEVEIFTIYEGADCGSWVLNRGAAEGPHFGGNVSGASGSEPLVTRIQTDEPSYRTASGVGVGTSLEDLRRIYGDRLVVDRADGWEHPTDGLLASYVDVAAVRYGDAALTYMLMEDVVVGVKLSRADDWGDDEGCA